MSNIRFVSVDGQLIINTEAGSVAVEDIPAAISNGFFAQHRPLEQLAMRAYQDARLRIRTETTRLAA